MCWWFFELAIWWLLHKTVRFLCSENGKCLFGATKRKTSSCNIVCHAMMHMYAQYGHIITNYALILAELVSECWRDSVMLLPTPVILATVVVVLAAAVIAVIVGVAVIEPLESTRGLDLRVPRGLDLRVARPAVRGGGSVIGHYALESPIAPP